MPHERQLLKLSFDPETVTLSPDVSTYLQYRWSRLKRDPRFDNAVHLVRLAMDVGAIPTDCFQDGGIPWCGGARFVNGNLLCPRPDSPFPLGRCPLDMISPSMNANLFGVFQYDADVSGAVSTYTEFNMGKYAH